MTQVLSVSGLSKHFPFRRGLFRAKGTVRAVDDISFSLGKGETLAIVGESGCGKSTVARLILRLIEPTAGTIRLDGDDITQASGEPLHRARRNMQMVFQDPFASLNPRLTARDIVAEPLINYGIAEGDALDAQVAALFEQVGLARYQADRYPHEFSGGQRQRIGIARALALDPSLVVADEPVAALDVSIQAQILNLMQDLQRARGLAYLFISHDLSVVEHVSRTVAVMYLGAIVEIAPRDAFFRDPLHPYSRALIDSVPITNPRQRGTRRLLQGEIPSASALPSGCRFRTRCPLATAICAEAAPPLEEKRAGHRVACHLVTKDMPPGATGGTGT
ncbi:MAG: ATP-binding cassette domain-containing protein [Rhizobiales bacterium]|nr:ATP-binding cassette domain-containing protein [Hyphomicrobiales bacterium]